MKYLNDIIITICCLSSLSCTSRGWQLSEQIQGVDNKLRPLAVENSNVSEQSNLKRSTSSEFTEKRYVIDKIKLRGEFTPTSFNQPGLLLISE